MIIRRLARWCLIALISLNLSISGCGSKAAVKPEQPPIKTEAPPTATKPAEKPVVPQDKPAPVVTSDPAEAPAEAAILAADWARASELYTNLVLSNLKSPISEYYFYRLLWVASYSQGTTGATMSKTLQTVIDKPETNEPLRALATWIRANGALRQGDLKTAQADIDRLGFVRDFLFIGPFESEEETGFKKEYPPEKELDLAKEYEGKGGLNRWFKSAAAPCWGWVDLANLFRLKDDVLAYAAAFINAPTDQEVAFRLGSDGAIKLWLNDTLIWESDTYRSLYLDQELAGAKLVKGWNKLLIKSCAKRGPWRFMVRLTDTVGKPVSGLAFETDIEKIKALKFPPANPEMTSQKSEVKSGVLAMLKDKIAANPRDAVALVRAGFICDIKHNLDENDRTDRDNLQKALNLLNEVKAANALWQLLLGWVEPERNKRLEAYKQALASAPRSPLVQFEFSRAYTGDTSWYKDLTVSWEDIFESWIEGREFDYEQSVRRAQKDTLTSKQRSFPVEEKEMGYLTEALRLKPDFVAARMALAKCYERRGGLWRHQAIRIFREVQTIVPEHREIKEAILLADYKRLGIDEIIKRYEELLKDNYTEGKLRKRLVELYKSRCQLDKARDLAQAAIGLNPYQYQNYLLLADLYRSEDKIAEGVKALEAARGVSPEATAVLDKLASFYHLSGDEAKAIATWEELLKVRPQEKEVTKHLKVLKGEKDDFWKGYEENLAEYIEAAKGVVRSEEKESAAWLLNNQIIKVKSNGTSSMYVQQVIRIFDDKGRNEYNSVSAWPGGHDYYVASRAEVKRATVIRKDGAEIEGQYYEDSAYASFPRLEIDDIIIFECQIDEVGEARYKGYFGLMCPFQGGDDPVKTAKITVINPKNKPLYFQLVRAKSEPKQTEKGDQLIRTWTASDIPQIKEEYFKPAYNELWPYLHISTFKTWDEVAEWVWGIAKDQFESSPEIKAAVAKAIEGKTTTLDKIKAVYQLLVSNVRYEFINLEAHGFKPFKAVDTFARKYGDCKDTATLMVTMLKEAGIPANIVVIRAMPTSIGVVDTELPSMKIFNHMIAQVPDVEGSPMFLDGTARYCGAEEFPSMDQGAVAFVVTPQEKGKCAVTAYEPAEKNLSEINGTVTLAADNSARIEGTMSYRGQAAPYFRERFQEGTKRELLFEQMMNRYLAGSKVESLSFSDIADYNLPVEVKTVIKIPQVSRSEGTQMFFKSVLLPPEINDVPLKYFALAETRYYDVVMPYRERSVYRVTYQAPAGYKIKTIPDNFSRENEYARCSITFKKEGDDKIAVESLLETKAARVPQADYAKFRAFCVEVEKAAEEEVVLEK